MSIPKSALRFATGGLVPGPQSLRYAQGGAVPSSSGGGGSKGMDTVNVNVTIGGEKMSLFAERQQAGAFVKALKRMEVGS
jgi:hypothetical protein